MTASAAAAPAIRFHLPSATLAPYLTAIYVVEAPGAFVDHLHPEWANIRLIMSGDYRSQPVDGPIDPVTPAAIYGPSDRTRRIETGGGTVIGIGLTPLGWLALIREDAGAHANRVTPLGDRLGLDETALFAVLAGLDEAAQVAALIDLLEARINRAAADAPLVLAIHRHLIESEDDRAIALADAVGTSERTLHRLALRAFGFAPKRLLRRQRFLRALDRLGGEIEGGFSAGLGEHYYDQSHFIREFRLYMGMTPSAYYQSPRAALRRAAAARKQALGASLQGLHPAG